MPALGIVAAWELVLAGKQEATETVLESVERALERSGPGRDDGKTLALQGDVAIIRAFLNDLASNAPRAIELTRAADGLLLADHLIGRSLVFLILGRAFLYQGDLESADRVFSDRLRYSTDSDNIWSMSNAVFWLLVLRRHQGNFDGCEQMIREYEAHVDRHHARGGGQLAKTLAVAGELKREQGHLEETAGMIGDAVKQVEGWGMPSEVYFCLYFLVRAQRSLGRVQETTATLEKADEILRTSTVLTVLQMAFESERVKSWLALGDMALAVAWADRHQSGGTESPLNQHMAHLTLARVRLASGGVERRAGQGPWPAGGACLLCAGPWLERPFDRDPAAPDKGEAEAVRTAGGLRRTGRGRAPGNCPVVKKKLRILQLFPR